MNLVEHYINKVINIEEAKDPVTLMDFIIVTMEVDCYGNTETIRKSYRDIFELNEDMAKGYFLG